MDAMNEGLLAFLGQQPDNIVTGHFKTSAFEMDMVTSLLAAAEVK